MTSTGRLIGLVGVLLAGGAVAFIPLGADEESQPPVDTAVSTEGIPSPVLMGSEEESAKEERIRSSVVAPSLPKSFSSPAEVTERGSNSDVKPSEDSLSFQNVTLVDGRLSVQVQNGRLGRLLDEISQKAKVAILTGEGLEGWLITAEFSDLPLDEGLRQILSGQDIFFYYRAGALLKAIWVYPKDEGAGLEPVPPNLWASTRDLEVELTDWDPKRRARAIEALVERKGDLALDAVMKALEDPDEWVRTQALYGASGADVELPSDTLANLARDDPSENVRFLALDALAVADDPNIDFIATYALDDPSPHLRNKAEEILDRLDAAAQPGQPGRPAQQAPPNGQ